MQTALRNVDIFLLMTIFPLFFWWGPSHESARSLQELWNLGHSFFFFLLTLYLFDNTFLSRLNPLPRMIVCLAVTIILGGIIELVQQIMPERVSSMNDLLRDLTGSMIALFYITIKASSSKSVRVTAMMCSFALLAMTFFSLIVVIHDEIVAARTFPLLADFEYPYEQTRWGTGGVQVARVSSPVRKGSFSLRIDFSTEKYSGIELRHFPRGWDGYATLCFSVYNPGKAVELHFRVHDMLHQESPEYSNRYNKRILLVEGWNDVRIDMRDIRMAPKGRVMDFGNIYGVVFFVMEQEVGRTLYLDALRLE